MSRAIDLAESRALREVAWHIGLDLAKALADGADDLPAAVARARSVPDIAPRSLEARALEGRWRAKLGDLAGASLAFARARDLAAMHVERDLPPHGADAEPFAWLMEAATFEREVRHDLQAAQRHVAVALRLRPHDESARAWMRELGFAIAGESPPETRTALRAAPPALDIALLPDTAPTGDSRQAPAPLPVLEALDDAQAEARVEELTRRVQAAPNDDRVIDELSILLERLGRGHELLALLSARIDEATPERRAILVPRARQALAHLEAEARANGRDSEANLYRDAAAMFERRC
jgi:hypothetical protein